MKSNNKQQTINQYLNALDQPNFWRLFVDGARQDSHVNIISYDKNNLPEANYGHLLWAAKEPNSLNSLKQTAKKLFSEQLDKELTFDFIQEIHHSAYPFQDYLRLSPSYMHDDTERTFCAREEFSDLDDISVRAGAIKIIVNSVEAPWGTGQNEHGHYFIGSIWSYEEKIKNFEILHRNYQQDILNTSLDKLETILQFMQDIECMHFFRDGNCRMVNLFLNKELMKHGFEPVILFDPNDFDYKSIEQLKEEIFIGQKAYKDFIETGLPYETCVSDQQIATNIAQLSAEQVKLGDVDINYAKFSEYCETFKNTFREYSSKNYSFQEICQKWNNTLQFVLIKDCLINNDRNNEIDRCLQNISYLQKVLKEMFDNDQNILNQQYLESVQSFLEYTNIGYVIKYLEDNYSQANKTFKQLLITYLDELQELCQKYMTDYDIESLANPVLCHLTKTEQEALIHNDESVNLDIDTLSLVSNDDNKDVEASGVAQEETTE